MSILIKSILFSYRFKISIPVNKRIGVALSNCTHINSSLHLEISLNTPCCTPRVLDIPELNSLFISISSCQYCVVNILSGLSTVSNSVNTSCIVFESSYNLEWDGNGSCIIESFSEFIFISLRDVIASMSAISNWDIWSMNAWICFGYIWIGNTWLEPTNVFNIFESMRW